jgi:D-alanyl-lipoteichoic acid acyltransferase DltB (MBOAT superfamily)
MIFNSIEFLIFFPIVLALYFLLPKKVRWVALLAASLFFYLYWSVKLIFLILFTTVVSYVSAIIIEKNANRKGLKRFFLIITLVACFGVLFFFKYYNFAADSAAAIASLFGPPMRGKHLDLILPVGISFYTFQTLSFVIDVYKGKVKAERHFGYYALYVTFFPQLVAGPIERPENLLPQLRAENSFSWDNAKSGLRKMLVGFFKKIVVADLMAVYVDSVYNAPGEARGLSILIATLMFAVQIYCDFSGYTDIAIGCSEVMGIRLMQNFNHPYSATSIKDFWNRWHISLSTWFRDYLYFPLGGSRCSIPRHLFNLTVVFLVSGLWHGAAWTFVIWGGLHAFYQVVGVLIKKPRGKLYAKLKLDENSRGVTMWKRAITFILVDFAWIFFRANSLSDAGLLIRKLFTDWEFSFSYISESLSLMDLGLIGILTSVLAVIYMQRMDGTSLAPAATADGKSKPIMASFNYVYIGAMIAIAWLILEATGSGGAFIYFQF